MDTTYANLGTATVLAERGEAATWDSSAVKFVRQLNLAHAVSPMTAEILLTNRCNQRCAHCRYTHDGHAIAIETCLAAIDTLVEMGIGGVILTGGGEPLLHPEFEQITQRLEDIAMPYGVNSNLSIVRQMNPTWLKVSLDATNRDEYMSLRGVDHFGVVLQNITRFRVDNPRTHLSIQCIVRTPNQASAFVRAHRNLDVDCLYLRPMETSSSAAYPPPALASIREELARLKKLDPRVRASDKWQYVDRPVHSCRAAWTVLTVDANGMVPYCVQKPAEIVGSLFDPQIVLKRLNHTTDAATCERPCRLSGLNALMAAAEMVMHPSFV